MAGRFERAFARWLATAACATLAAWVAAAPAQAQVSTATTPVLGPVPIARPHDDLDALTRHFNAGAAADLRALAAAIVADVRAAAPALREALDIRRRHVVLLWIGADVFGTARLVRLVVHDSASETSSPDLPGVREVHEVFLSHTRDGQAASVYASTRQRDPIGEALPDFVRAVAGPLFGRIGVLAGTEAADGPRRVWATISKVALPFERASVKVRSVAADPWLDLAAFTGALQSTAAKVSFTHVPNSECARGHAEALAGALAERASRSCDPGRWNLGDCRQALDTEMKQRLAAQSCGKPSRPREENTPLLRVDKEFRTLVSAWLANGADLDLAFRNRPRTRVAFGAGSGVIIDARFDRPRVKLDDGVLVADPLGRVMTTAFVNISPAGYDAEAERIGVHERVRLFAGAVLTPDFGVAGGVNVLIARGVGVSLGVAVLFARGAEPSQVGRPAADSADPFRLAVATAPFVGITYNYK